MSFHQEIDYWTRHREAGLRAVEVADRNLDRIAECMGGTALRGAEEMLAGNPEHVGNEDWPGVPDVAGRDL